VGVVDGPGARFGQLLATNRNPRSALGIRSLHVDELFLGCHGIDPAAGLTTPNLAESETNRAFIQAARRVTALADHTKWGVVALSSFAGLQEVDTLISDAELAPHAREVAAVRVGRLLIAGQ
jgi:DeoR/GlpR family transcriptional regulator of sugar metabolism